MESCGCPAGPIPVDEELEQGQAWSTRIPWWEFLSFCFLDSSEARLRGRREYWEYKKWSKGEEDKVGWRVREKVWVFFPQFCGTQLMDSRHFGIGAAQLKDKKGSNPLQVTSKAGAPGNPGFPCKARGWNGGQWNEKGEAGENFCSSLSHHLFLKSAQNSSQKHKSQGEGTHGAQGYPCWIPQGTNWEKSG